MMFSPLEIYSTEKLPHSEPKRQNCRFPRWLKPRKRAALQGVMAMTRKGLPEPPTIFSGAAMTMAPVGGS